MRKVRRSPLGKTPNDVKRELQSLARIARDRTRFSVADRSDAMNAAYGRRDWWLDEIAQGLGRIEDAMTRGDVAAGVCSALWVGRA